MENDATRARPTRRRLVAIFALIALAGCDQNAAPTAADEDRARQLLDSTLGAWKEGKTIEDLKKSSPSVIVSDPAWERGGKLGNYEVEGPGKPSGAERAFTVTLTLSNAKGKDTRQQVVYKVGTDPVLTVFRALF